jgi:hypothetical protein
MARVRTLVFIPLIVLLVSCRPGAPDPVDAEPDLSTYPPAAPVECIPMSAGAIAGLQWGFDDKQPGFSITRAVAYDPVEWDSLYIVAAGFVGPGLGENVGLWATQQDPATAEDAAYNSVDAFAAEFTSYVQPAGINSANAPGVDEVRECLVQVPPIG